MGGRASDHAAAPRRSHRPHWLARDRHAAAPVPDDALDVQSRRVSGDLMVYEDGIADIYGRRLSTGRTFPIAVGPPNHRSPDIDGDNVVWVDRGDGRGTHDQIVVHNLRTGVTRQLTTVPGAKQAPRIFGDRVVWRGNRNADSAFYGCDLTSGTGDAYLVVGTTRS